MVESSSWPKPEAVQEIVDDLPAHQYIGGSGPRMPFAPTEDSFRSGLSIAACYAREDFELFGALHAPGEIISSGLRATGLTDAAIEDVMGLISPDEQ